MDNAKCQGHVLIGQSSAGVVALPKMALRGESFEVRAFRLRCHRDRRSGGWRGRSDSIHDIVESLGRFSQPCIEPLCNPRREAVILSIRSQGRCALRQWKRHEYTHTELQFLSACLK